MGILEIENFAKEHNVSIRFDFYSQVDPLISMRREDLYTERTLTMNILMVLATDRLILPVLEGMVEELDEKESEDKE